MHKIGLIGGTGPESTILYYKEINRLISERTDGERFPEISIDSLNLFDILPLCEGKEFEKLAQILSNSANNLVACGSDYVAFTAVTCHMVYPQVKSQCPVPMISIPESVAEYAQSMGYKKVGLLGTIYTMDMDYMSGPIKKHGIDVIVPTGQEKDIVSTIIYSEIEYGIIKPESVARLTSIIDRMKNENGIEAVILGCTELPLVLNDSISPVPCIDTVKIHIDKLVELALE